MFRACLTMLYLIMTKQTLEFRSNTGIFLWYAIAKWLPLVAVVYYFSTLLVTLITAALLLAFVLLYSGLTNHWFSLEQDTLLIHPVLLFWKPIQRFPLTKIDQIQIKGFHEQDRRQWLSILTQNSQTPVKFRCDWLHLQDPPEEEEHAHEHEHPEHELFELLEEEDFYEGSLQHLAQELSKQNISVQFHF